jgi:hypothetical protein
MAADSCNQTAAALFFGCGVADSGDSKAVLVFDINGF